MALNLALIVLIAGASWRLRQNWIESQERQQKILGEEAEPETTPVAPVPQPPGRLTAAAYEQIAQQMLFSRDRNPNFAVEIEAPKPMPPLPVAHGVVNFGEGPVAILSAEPGAPHRGFMTGETVGEFKVVGLNHEEIVLEWDGRQIKRKFSELQSAASAPEAAMEAVRQPAPAKPTVEAPAREHGPGAVMAGEVRACVPGDTSPPGTVRNGLRKLVSDTPFGKVCRWEPVQ